MSIRIACAVLTLSWLVSSGGHQLVAQSPTLEPNRSVERSIQPGDEHRYPVTLVAGEAARFELGSLAALSLALVRPDGGTSVLIPDSSAEIATEPATVLARESGPHTVVVRVREGEAGGLYRLQLDGAHPATESDLQRARAEALLREGLTFTGVASKESRLAAVDRFQQSVALSRTAADPLVEVIALSKLGQMFNRLGEAQKAIDAYLAALEIFRALGEPRSEASTLNNVGLEYRNLGKYDRAVDALARSAGMFHQLADKAGERSPRNNLGLTFLDLGQVDQARAEYNVSLALARETADRNGEAYALAGLAGAASLEGRLQSAIDDTTSALEIWRGLGNRQLEAQMLGNLGQTQMKLGDTAAGLRYFLRAQEIEKLAPNRRLEAQTQRNIAQAYFQLGEPGKALPFIRTSLKFWRELDNRPEEAEATSLLADILANSQQPAEAIDAYAMARTLAHDAQHPNAEIHALTGLSSVRLNQGQYLDAFERASEAVTLARRSSLKVAEEQALVSLGRVESARNELTAARGHLESAIELAESIRLSVAGPDWRTSYFSRVRDKYDLLIDVLMRLHERTPTEGLDARALELSERARARGLLDLLGESRANIREGIDPQLLERDRKLRTMLAGRKDGADRGLEAVLGDYRQLQNEIHARSPHYAALVQPEPVRLDDIQHRFLDDDTALVEYVLGEERSYVWVATPTGLVSRVLPARARIETAARTAYDALRDPGAPGGRESLRALGRLLLDPIADLIGTKRLAIVTEGPLQYIPLASLPDAAGRALVESHEIISLPSASTLEVLRRELDGRPPAPRSLFVLGDPVFDRRDPRVHSGKTLPPTPSTEAAQRSAEESGAGSLERLYFTRGEAEDLASLAQDGTVRPLLDFDASLDRVKGESLGSYRYIHLATHGLLNNRHPELSGLVFSLVDAEGRPRDGFLPAYDVYNLRLNADLVVLSACQTALGEDIRGEGLVGLARGFMYAGAARVVSSLWSVPDSATAELMRRFYRGMLVGHLPPAAALRAAQRSIRAEPRWSAPYYWAGFVIQGEWR
jgi:CHAT domain-containing protein/tetratricopeptide (TPR) repeat protein